MRSAWIGLSAAMALSATSTDGATVAEWRQDIEHIVDDIRTFHPAPFTKTGELTFRRRVAELEEALPALSEEQRVVAMMRIVALLGDGHTQLVPGRPSFGEWYPIRMYEFRDGIFISTAHKSVADLAGAQVLEIAGRPVGEVLLRARELTGCDNAFDCQERISAAHNSSLMKGLGYAAANGELKLRIRLPGGSVADRTLTPHAADDPHYEKDDSSFDWRYRREVFGTPVGSEADWVTAFHRLPASAFRTADASRPPHLTVARSFFTRALSEHDAYYIQCYQVDEGGFAGGFANALQEVDKLRPRRLIIDLRYNIGGDGSLVPAVIREFIRREASPPWKELYLLIGRKTFSAGIMTAVAFIDNCELTVIGEPAGAARNSYGDANDRPFPTTGLRLHVSTLRHELSESNDVREIIPVAVPASFTFAEWSKGEDPAVDPILRGDEMRSIPIIARTSGGAAARKVFAERKSRFASLGWWQPPAEIELRQACQQLVREKRLDDALETCRLNTEIHPFNWRPWLNLARAQRAAGLLADRLASLRRVLEIDPNNFNGDDIRAALADGLRPSVVRFGATIAETQGSLAGMCTSTNVREIDPPFLPNVKNKQMQIDCEGFPFLGKPRHAEFVFRDDSLEMSWIMTTAEEEPAISAAMHSAYSGSPLRNAKYEAFPAGRAALRFKPAEVLFYSQSLATDFEQDFR